jgi:pimeloyl-ACP methyl ester carboxylesterase
LSDKGWDRDYGHAAQAARVVGFMDAMGIDRAHVVGHSMGGSVAAHLALSYPGRVNRLVLVAGAVAMEGDHNAGSEFLPVPPVLLELSFARRWGQILMRRYLVPEFENLLYDAAYADAMITPEIEVGYRRVLNTPDWDSGLMGIIRDGDRQGLPAPLSAIQAPTLLLWGTEDSWVAPSTADRLAQLIPTVEQVDFEGVGHLPMHEVPDAFNRALLDFLERD